MRFGRKEPARLPHLAVYRSVLNSTFQLLPQQCGKGEVGDCQPADVAEDDLIGTDRLGLPAGDDFRQRLSNAFLVVETPPCRGPSAGGNDAVGLREQ